MSKIKLLVLVLIAAVFATHRSRQLVYSQSSFQHPPEIYLLELEGSAPKALSAFNAEVAIVNQIRGGLADEAFFFTMRRLPHVEVRQFGRRSGIEHAPMRPLSHSRLFEEI